MNEPRGYNPVGDHAAGLPRHDAPLPGHVPGSYTPGQTDDSAAYPSASFNPGGLPLNPIDSAVGIWGGRFFLLALFWVSVPIQMALYPFAGAAGLVAGGVVYLLTLGAGMGYETHMSWSEFGALLGVLPAIRFEQDFADGNPQYVKGRHLVRLVLLAGVWFWFEYYDRHDPLTSSVLVTAIVTVAMHFILRSKFTRGVWHVMLHNAWLRSNL